MASCIQRLRDPQLVADFQQFFGVRPLRTLTGQQRAQLREKRVAYGSLGLDEEHRRRTKEELDQQTNGQPGVQPRAEARDAGHKQEARRRRRGQSEPSAAAADDGSASDSSSSSGARAERQGLNRTSRMEYALNSRFFYYLFSFGASLGYEIFYGSFFPFWFWNVDGWVGRR